MPTLGLVILAAGSSARFGKNKLLLPLEGKCLFRHCLDRLVPAVGVSRCVLVVPSGNQKQFQAELPPEWQELPLAEGGATRAESALQGLLALPAAIDYVAIQDAARPFTTPALLQECYQKAQECGAAIAAHRVTDTIKLASPDGLVQDTLDRSTLWAAETPQVFCREWIETAYRSCLKQGIAVTDDAQAVQLLGHPVHLVENLSPNRKITYPHDLP